jgi:hypothetical protein
MGIFSDRCDALIDPQTGRALGAEALAQAKQDPKWPRCGNRVRKAARFCNKCGVPAPGGWWRCPSCNKWVGNEAQFCSHCNAPLYPEDRAVMAGGVWRKDPGLFAQRFEIGDIKRLLQDELLIQEGTVAVVLDGGHIHGILESGRHKPDSLARRINWFGDPPPRSTVMVDAGDVALPLRVTGLRTSEHHPIEFYGEVILRFGNDKAAALALLANGLKDRRHLAYKDLSESLQGVIRAAVDEMCVTSTLDDLVRDPARRLRLQENMIRTIGADIGRFGLQVVRVSSAEFTGNEYEEYAERLGEVDIKRRELEYAAAIRALLNKEAMSQIKDKADLLEYEELAAQEHGIAHAQREQERTVLVRGYTHLNELDELRHQHDVETLKTEQAIGVHIKWDDYNLRLVVKEAQANADARRVAFAEEMEEGFEALKLREEKDRVELARKVEDKARRQNMTLDERILDEDDPAKRKELLEIMRASRNQNMTPEQILAESAANSPAAADALARLADKSKENAERVLSELKKVYADANERQDKNLKTMLEPVIEAAKRQAAQPQTIIH